MREQVCRDVKTLLNEAEFETPKGFALFFEKGTDL